MTKQNFKKYGSVAILALMSLILLWQNIENAPWKKQRIIRSDVSIYYTYLPATIINNDPFFELKDTLNSGKYRVRTSEIGRNSVKMSMGVAFMDLPFFYVGHLYALSSDKYEADGYSEPYHLAISISSAFYTIMGFIFLWLVLKRTFTELASLLTVILIVFGTNLYLYSVYETGMSHPITFFLLSALLYLVQNWLNRKRIWKSFLIGILLGLIVLVRPINILFILPIIILLKNRHLSWVAYFKTLFLPFSYVIPVLLGGILIILPQLIFWKFQTGSILSYSYGKEGFFWMNPHVWEVLFSFRKGWFIYTPLMFFALFGMVRLFKIQRMYFWAIIIFLPIFFYVTFSWWCWWYGGSFGARTLIDILPFMAIPLAALIDWMLGSKWRYALLLIPFLLMRVNLFQSWQYAKGILHFDSMTWEGYKTIFFKDYTTNHYWRLLQEPDYSGAVNNGVEKELYPVVTSDPQSPAYEKSIQNTIKYLKSDEGWMKSVRERAENKNISMDSSFRVTAIWVLEQE